MDKREIWQHCMDWVGRRMQETQLAIEEANRALQEETKSSAGDKYETSREMIQQDLNRYQQQMTVAAQDLSTLEKSISSERKTGVAGLGSLVQTDTAFYFLAVSIGVINVGGEQVFAISLQSPLGRLLAGRSVGDTFDFNGKMHTVTGIY